MGKGVSRKDPARKHAMKRWLGDLKGRGFAGPEPGVQLSRQEGQGLHSNKQHLLYADLLEPATPECKKSLVLAASVQLSRSGVNIQSVCMHMFGSCVTNMLLNCNGLQFPHELPACMNPAHNK